MANVHGLELELTPMDSFYYASREAGEVFMTKEYIMNTALYYALDLFPSRFRTAEQRPRYLTDREDSYWDPGVYISPATAIDRPQFQTRRFAVKTDEYRSVSERRSSNFKETGHMKTIDPDCGFLAFAVCRDEELRDELHETMPSYCRLGKKMSSTRVDCQPFTSATDDGEFQLGHPVGALDLPQNTYTITGNVSWTRMTPVDLLSGGTIRGPHIKYEPSWKTAEEIALPAEARFIAEREGP